MSGIVLSASVRQNLLSLQSTAALLATTQNDLATGKKVNSALDNPTNFFTAQGLDNRANDIANLLDGIGNGVQVLQAANTGITSLQKLIDSAKSTANQALQTTIGYSTKSNVSTTIAGATSADLRGTTTFASSTAFSNVLYSGAAGGTTAASGSTAPRSMPTRRPRFRSRPRRRSSVPPVRCRPQARSPTAIRSASTARPSP
jgi:flagellin